MEFEYHSSLASAEFCLIRKSSTKKFSFLKKADTKLTAVEKLLLHKDYVFQTFAENTGNVTELIFNKEFLRIISQKLPYVMNIILIAVGNELPRTLTVSTSLVNKL